MLRAGPRRRGGENLSRLPAHAAPGARRKPRSRLAAARNGASHADCRAPGQGGGKGPAHARTGVLPAGGRVMNAIIPDTFVLLPWEMTLADRWLLWKSI